jgi:single-strand DNA-binding protein
MNTINLVGRLARDPELRGEGTDTLACRMRLALPRRPRSGGENAGADFVDVISFGYAATACADFLTKGRQVGITGRLHQSEWTTDAGEPRSRLEVIADNVEFLDRPENSGRSAVSAQT